MAETIEWYRANTVWLEHVLSGEYASYYTRMYEQ
jgi:dTDP-D-glucose 4,6-dehydratase